MFVVVPAVAPNPDKYDLAFNVAHLAAFGLNPAALRELKATTVSLPSNPAFEEASWALFAL